MRGGHGVVGYGRGDTTPLLDVFVGLGESGYEHVAVDGVLEAGWSMILVSCPLVVDAVIWAGMFRQ